MIRSSKKKASALFDYALVLIMFGLAMAVLYTSMDKNAMKTYFERSIDSDASTDGSGTLTLSQMGE